MSFCRSWTGVEILVDEFLSDVGAPVKEAASHRLEEGRYFWVAQCLVCKLDCVSPRLDGVGEAGYLSSSIMGIRWYCDSLCWCPGDWFSSNISTNISGNILNSTFGSTF